MKSQRDRPPLKAFHDGMDLKRGLTEMLITIGQEEDWPNRFRANRDRARKSLDLGDPSSLMVWKFDTGLDQSCSYKAFIERVLPIITACTPAIDDLCGHKL